MKIKPWRFWRPLSFRTPAEKILVLNLKQQKILYS